MTIQDSLEIGSSAWSRNVGGATATILLVALGTGLWSIIFNLTSMQFMFASTLNLALSIGFYAEFYHRSIMTSLPSRKFYLGVSLAAFLSTIFVCFVTKYMMKF